MDHHPLAVRQGPGLAADGVLILPAPDRAAPHKEEPRVVGPGVQGVCGLVAGRGFEPLTFGL